MAAGRSARRTLALCGLAAVLFGASPAGAQDEKALATARKTFAQGIADEDDRRYDAALEEFRRVLLVKDTANVRYRMASCLEPLGQRAAALESYEAAVRVGAGDPAAAATVEAARARIAALERLVARVTLVFAGDPPPGARVIVDDTPVTPAALNAPVVLDAGHHSVLATAPGRASFRVALTLAEGARVTVGMNLVGEPPSETAAPEAVTASPHRPSRAGAFVALGVGGLLAIGSGIAFVLRGSNLAILDRDCHTIASDTLSCPRSRADEISAAHSAAQIEGAIGLGAVVGSALAVGTGIWLYARSPDSPSRTAWIPRVWLAPALTPQGAAFTLRSAF